MTRSSPVESSDRCADAWYADWQNPEHARHFDHRARLSRRGLQRNLERFNDVRFFREIYSTQTSGELLEVGCATGEFYRYLQLRCPRIRYAGVDISRPAVERARAKYPQARFALIGREQRLSDALAEAALSPAYRFVYSKDVLHHQVDPWSFLEELLKASEEWLIFRTRTRDRGPTVLDPERSCQYHYGDWMPYVVFHLEDLIQRILSLAPRSELRVRRNHQVLGGRENRFLPKECYLPQTGTAETAFAIGLKTDHPGRVQVEDRPDRDLVIPWKERLRGKIGTLFFSG